MMAHDRHRYEIRQEPTAVDATSPAPFTSGILARGPAGRASRTTGRAVASRRRLSVLALLLLALTVVATGCADDGRASIATARTQVVPLERALDVMLRAPGPDAAEGFLASLPEPVTAEVRSVKNAYDPGTNDAMRTLVYDDLSLTVYEVTNTGDRFPIAVALTGPGQSSSAGLRVGLDASSVRGILGEADAVNQRTGAWHYDVMEQGAAPYAIDIVFEAGAVASVTWTAYLD